jgi:hypothetical protein
VVLENIHGSQKKEQHCDNLRIRVRRTQLRFRVCLEGHATVSPVPLQRCSVNMVPRKNA